jgi:hypothetical protein
VQNQVERVVPRHAVVIRMRLNALVRQLPDGSAVYYLDNRAFGTRRDHCDVEPTVDMESGEALVLACAAEWALVLA